MLFQSVLPLCLLVGVLAYVPEAPSKPESVHLVFSCIHATSDGSVEASSPILLLHGLGGSKEYWTGFYEVLALQTGRKVCIVDARNHGNSPWSDEAGFDAMAADIVSLLDVLKAPRAIFLGHSMGGKTAIHLAVNHPELVEKLIVEDICPNSVDPGALKHIQGIMKILVAAMGAVPEGSDEDAARKFILNFVNEIIAKNKAGPPLDESLSRVLPVRCTDGKCQYKFNLKIFLEALNDPHKFFIRSEGTFEGPALFIYGTKSPFKVGEAKDEILETFPNAKMVPIEGAHHNVRLFNRQQYTEEVLKFIKST